MLFGLYTFVRGSGLLEATIKMSSVLTYTSSNRIYKAVSRIKVVVHGLNEYLQGMSIINVLALAQLSQIWIEGHQSILRTQI